MESILEKIDRLKAEYDALLPMADENRKKLEKKFRLEFNYNSNHIEGNTLTYGETELLLLFDETKGDHSLREYEEMKAHDVAYQLVQQWAADPRPITETDIKSLNEVLLVRPYWKDAVTPDGQNTRRQILVGEYKQFPNSVMLANGEIFEYASPIETPAKMEELMAWYQQESDKNNTHPLLLAAMLHYKFVCIHPFDDGNGRVSRLLMNYVLFRCGFPPVVIKSADKPNYRRTLNQADVGDTAAFVTYIGEQLVWSLELSVKAAKGESVEEPDDLDKELALLKRELSSKNVLEQEASIQVVEELVSQSIAPMLEMLEEKLQVFHSSFFDLSRELTIKVWHDTNIYPVNKGNIPLGEQFKTWFAQNKGLKHPLESVKYQYILKGFKNNTNGRNFSVYIEINMNPYNFKIRDVFYPYGRPFTQEKMKEIITPVIRELMEQIKTANVA